MPTLSDQGPQDPRPTGPKTYLLFFLPFFRSFVRSFVRSFFRLLVRSLVHSYYLSLHLIVRLSACMYLQSGYKTQVENFENFSPFCSRKRDRERELFLVPENRWREVFGNCFHENFGNWRDMTGKL